MVVPGKMRSKLLVKAVTKALMVLLKKTVSAWTLPTFRPNDGKVLFEIQKFAGALQGQRAKKGIFITTSNFSKEAYDYVSRIDNKIVLMDGEKLTQLMIENHLGVSTVASYDILKIDTDYFTGE